MPSSPPDSSGSPPPSATPSPEGALPPIASAAPAPLAWRTNAWLFLGTVASAFITRYELADAGPADAARYTAALMSILLAHEFGHFIAARIHRVDASLPYFIPLPLVSPFGTLGAVIRMRSLIPTRRALLDIGAAGPLAGLAVAIPLYVWGFVHSEIVRVGDVDGGTMQLGSSLLMRSLERLFGPALPDGTDMLLSPVAFAGWVGMFVTMINLVPLGQLDAGHVAYALFGPRQNVIARWVHRSMLVFFFVSLGSFVARDIRAGIGLWHFGRHVDNALFWLMLFEGFAVLGAMSAGPRGTPDGLGVTTRAFAMLGLALIAGILRDQQAALPWAVWCSGLVVLVVMEIRGGALRPSSTLLDHPPTGPEPLRGGRVAIAVVTLAFFVLLFMPAPITFE
jgi:membrane-associated protease RseP (regulator of RpoE activity)